MFLEKYIEFLVLQNYNMLSMFSTIKTSVSYFYNNYSETITNTHGFLD